MSDGTSEAPGDASIIDAAIDAWTRHWRGTGTPPVRELSYVERDAVDSGTAVLCFPRGRKLGLPYVIAEGAAAIDPAREFEIEPNVEDDSGG